MVSTQPNPIGPDFIPNNLPLEVTEQCSPALQLCTWCLVRPTQLVLTSYPTVLATIKHIVADDDWWYTTCLCNKTVYLDSKMFFVRSVTNMLWKYNQGIFCIERILFSLCFILISCIILYLLTFSVFYISGISWRCE